MSSCATARRIGATASTAAARGRHGSDASHGRTAPKCCVQGDNVPCLRLNSRNVLPLQRKQKVLDVDEAAAQEEWDAIADEAPSGAPALSASQVPSTISYDEAVAALTAVDMSAAVPRVVLYEAPASCFGRLLQCFSRPSLHIQNAEEELQLPFLLALTPFDGYHPLGFSQRRIPPHPWYADRTRPICPSSPLFIPKLPLSRAPSIV